jgi:hypothetical protein
MSENPVTPVSPVGGEVDVALAEMMARQWVTFRKHRPAGAYLPVGQLDGDCHECGNAWPCPAVELILSPWLARLEAAESALEPGKAPAIVAAMFAEAQKRGHSPFSARHALSFLVEQLDEALAVVERVRAVAEGWKAIPKPQTGWSSGLSATEAGNRLGAWNVRRMYADEVLAALTPSAPTEEPQA